MVSVISSPVSSQGPAPQEQRSRLRSQATEDSTSKPALTSKRPVNFSFFEFSHFSAFFHLLRTSRDLFLRGVSTLLSPSTLHGTPKAKGATPVSTLSSDPAHQGHEGTPFLSRHLCRPPNFLSSCEASCVGPQIDCWFPIGPPGSQILACLRPIRTSAQDSTVCYLSTNVAHAYARSTFLGTTDDQTLGTSLRSFLLFAGNTFRTHTRHTRATRLQQPSSLSISTNALTDIEVNLHAYRPLLDHYHLGGPVTRHNTTPREATDGSQKWCFTALVFHYCCCCKASRVSQLSAAVYAISVRLLVYIYT